MDRISRLTEFATIAVLSALPVMAATAQTPAQLHALDQLAKPRVAEPSNVQATTVPLALPSGVAYDSAGNLYIAALNDNLVRKVDLKGVITTVAGTGEQGFAGDGGAATAAVLDSPSGVAIDAAGNIFISDSHNNRIREVVAATGNMTTVAGTGAAGYTGDGGAAAAATLNDPLGLALDGSGNLYIADTNNHVIRKITGSTISTVAGNGDQAFEGDNVAATATGLDSPNGIAVDASGNLYIGDTHNQRVRLVTVATGIITTLAGNGARAFTGDGTATSASLNRPRGVSVDAGGKVYVADSDNNRIRTVAGGAIATIAGNGEQGFAGDTAAATSAIIDTPRSTAVFGSGTTATATFSDAANQRAQSVSSTTGLLNTVAGVSLNGGLGLVLNGAGTDVYGTGQLTATFSNNGQTGTGTVTLLEGTTARATGTLSSNTATLSFPTLGVGTHTLASSYAGDSANPATASGVVLITVTAAPVVASANSVTIGFGAPIPPLTGTVTGVLPQDAGNVSAVFSTTAVQGSPVGTYPITVTLTGSAAGNYAVSLAGNSGSLTITSSATTVTLASSSISAYFGVPVTFSATVTSTTGRTPTGSVTFFDGGAPLGTGTLSASGVATYTTSSLSIGTHPITASYTAAAGFASAASGTLNEVIVADPDFSIAATTPTSITALRGSSATFGFQVASVGNTFTSPVTFTATGVPPGATVTFSPTAVTPSSSPLAFTMTVTPALSASIRLGAGVGGSLAFALLLLPFASRKRRRATGKLTRLTATVLLGLGVCWAATLMSGCGAGTALPSPQTYTITVTGTATNAAGVTVQRSTTVTLTVQ